VRKMSAAPCAQSQKMLSVYNSNVPTKAVNMTGTTKGNGFSKSVLSLRKKIEDEDVPRKLATFGLGGANDCEKADFIMK